MEKQEFIVQGLGQIHCTNGKISFDFTAQPEEEGGDSNEQDDIRVTMPIEAFLSCFDTQQQLIDKLVDAGILTKN